MSIATAPLLVEAPPTVPPRFGLLSVAQIPDTPDLHWADGVEYPTSPRPTAVTDDIDCDPDDLADLIGDIPWVSDDPVRVWTGVQVKRVGWDEGEVDQHVRGMLTAGEGPALERGLWPRLAGASTTLPAGDDPLSILSGVGALESWLWESYGGVGVLHVPRSAVGHLVRAEQVREVNGRLQTPLGTLVSAGAYPGRSPADDPAAEGAVWVAATPAVQLRRTPIRVQSSFGHRDNTQMVVADRVYVPSWENLSAAAHIQLETP
ncbi:hypothetical protein [Gordonia sp. (in: high G+C Gram-positive bacteria)]|uniref:hypothetical protein n=1 Tax=Gordonia sp. (in: high G+C Gram-positive bacteria) TaxID=84139 RepID=UPI00261BC7CF|nr:hypothetical protein [Gordonia sp. (in: high G+C Gram-positive bacteria)]